MITSSRSSTRTNLVFTAALLAFVFAGTGCSTSSLLTYAEESRNKGLREFQAGNYEAAAGSFRSASRQDPRDYKSFYYMGASYDKLNAPQQAAHAFQSALKVMDVTLEGREDKEFRAKVIDGLGISIAKGQDRTANLALPEPGKRPAEDAWLKAKVARYTGDADAALEAYNEAALHDPKDFYIAKDHALYLTDLGQNESATIQLRRAYRMNSKDQEIIAALTRVGTVPGPAIKSKNELAQPPIPRGPIPPLDIPKFGKSNQPAPAGDEAVGPTTPTVQAPRD